MLRNWSYNSVITICCACAVIIGQLGFAQESDEPARYISLNTGVGIHQIGNAGGNSQGGLGSPTVYEYDLSKPGGFNLILQPEFHWIPNNRFGVLAGAGISVGSHRYKYLRRVSGGIRFDDTADYGVTNFYVLTSAGLKLNIFDKIGLAIFTRANAEFLVSDIVKGTFEHDVIFSIDPDEVSYSLTDGEIYSISSTTLFSLEYGIRDQWDLGDRTGFGGLSFVQTLGEVASEPNYKEKWKICITVGVQF